MKTDPRGIVYALRRAVRENNRGMEDFLSETIIEHLERLDSIEARGQSHALQRVQPEPRAEEGERITPSRHQPKPSGIPGGTITSEGERIDPEDARGSRVTPTGVASTADDNAYHRNYTEAAMDERADALCERCHVAVIDKGTVLCETCLAACRIEWNPPGASLTSAAMAERDGGVEERDGLARWIETNVAVALDECDGTEENAEMLAKFARVSALLRSRTQPVGEPKWYEVTDSVLPDDPFTMRASNSALKELRGFTRYEIRPLYASPQPASVDVEALPDAIRHRRGPSARWMYEDWTPSIVSSVLEILPETGEIQPLYRALGTQKGGE